MALNGRFPGAWLLHSYEVNAPDGSLRLPLGEGPVGLFSFDAAGYFGVQLGPRNEDGAGYTAFFGTWTAPEGETGTLVLNLQTGSAPARIGGEQRRDFVFLSEDEVQLRPPMSTDGSQATIRWRRARAI